MDEKGKTLEDAQTLKNLSLIHDKNGPKNYIERDILLK